MHLQAYEHRSTHTYIRDLKTKHTIHALYLGFLVISFVLLKSFKLRENLKELLCTTHLNILVNILPHSSLKPCLFVPLEPLKSTHCRYHPLTFRIRQDVSARNEGPSYTPVTTWSHLRTVAWMQEYPLIRNLYSNCLTCLKHETCFLNLALYLGDIFCTTKQRFLNISDNLIIKADVYQVLTVCFFKDF